MAKLKFGTINVTVDPNNANKINIDGIPDLGLPKDAADMDAFVQKVIAAMPKPETLDQMKAQLSQFETELESEIKTALKTKEDEVEAKVNSIIKEIYSKIESVESELHSKVDELAIKIDEDVHNDIIVPAVNQITHVKDVSKEVAEEIKEFITAGDTALLREINDMKSNHKTSMIILFILGCLTSGLLIHFIK